MLRLVTLHICVSPKTRRRLGRLRTERHLNVGSWLRALIEEALDREFGPAAADEPSPPFEAALPDPLPGWPPAKVEGNVWGARFQGAPAPSRQTSKASPSP